MSLQRYSSRTAPLGSAFLAQALRGAKQYLRIAGYFRSSIFELVGEEIAQIPEVKILCNSELEYQDFRVATRESAIKEKWNQVDVAAEAFLEKERYQKLDTLLQSGRVEIRVVPKGTVFVHGKAGVITYADGQQSSFVGSVNETKSAFAQNYEIVWQDDDPTSAQWVEEEFWALWEQGIPLPEAVLDEIHRVANRREITVDVIKPKDVPGAALAEAPIYRGGEQLQPWQRSFVALFLEHRETYGKVRLLLADEVGVGKTLSMAASALISALLGDGPVLILAPSTLTLQWQVELKDRLGIPSAVWSSNRKVWLGPEGQMLSPKGEWKSIRKCPCRIAIVSTGLVFHQREGLQFVKEAEMLLRVSFGCVILDEAHKARVKGGVGQDKEEPNNLMAFMREISKSARHVILGTATPIQTQVRELWDLMDILGRKADFVLGDALSLWRKQELAAEMVKGLAYPKTAERAWEWLRNPLPPRGEQSQIDQIREREEIEDGVFESSRPFEELQFESREIYLPECTEEQFYVNQNPFVRHIVLRKRAELEEMGLLEKVGVSTHPLPGKESLYNHTFVDLGLRTNTPFEVAYEKAEEFCKLLQQRTQSAGFMKSLMLQRICSSFASGKSTAMRMLEHHVQEGDSEDESGGDSTEHLLGSMTSAEVACLKEIQHQLSRPEAYDPKLETVKWFLTEFQTEGKTWLEHGCIIFSQYYDTAIWVAQELAKILAGEVVAVYAGQGKSGLFLGEAFNSEERDAIKKAVKNRRIRLVVATDAACEGLNLQTLGTLINIDLPWNPSRLEQRLGRIKRFGQARKTVDMLNLVYHETRDQVVYKVLSDRLKDSYEIFGSLPDTIEDDWIDSEEQLRDKMNQYLHLRNQEQNAFSLRYKTTLDPTAHRWERCAEVLSRKDIVERMGEGW